jgi:hypothetical protein
VNIMHIRKAGYYLPHYVRADLAAPRSLHWTPLLDALLMDAISNGSTFSAAGRVCGMNKDQAAARVARLRHAMGWQAA